MYRPRNDDTRGFPRRSTLLLSLPAPIALSGSPRRPSLENVVQYSVPAFKWREWLNDWRCLEGSDTMKRKPKKVLVEGEEQGAGWQSFRELSTAVQDWNMWQNWSGFDSKQSLTLYWVKKWKIFFIFVVTPWILLSYSIITPTTAHIYKIYKIYTLKH